MNGWTDRLMDTQTNRHTTCRQTDRKWNRQIDRLTNRLTDILYLSMFAQYNGTNIVWQALFITISFPLPCSKLGGQQYYVHPPVQAAYIGETVQFKCTIPGGKWKKLSSHMTLPPGSFSFVKTTFTIRNITSAHYGNYSCYRKEPSIISVTAELLVGGKFVTAFAWIILIY